MRIVTKKWIVIGIVAAILLTSRIYEIARWLERYDLVYSAREFESMYLTGTTIAVVAALVFLLRNNGNGGHGNGDHLHRDRHYRPHPRNRRDF